MRSRRVNQVFDTSLTPKIRQAYTDFKLLEGDQSLGYLTFEARSLQNDSIHIIRTLNTSLTSKKQENYDAFATSFLQELFHLTSIHPAAILAETFEINGDKISVATLPYFPLNIEGYSKSLLDTKHKKIDIGDLYLSLYGEVEFLNKKLKMTSLTRMLKPENLYIFGGDENPLVNKVFFGHWEESFSGDAQEKADSFADSSASEQILLLIHGLIGEQSKIDRLQVASEIMGAMEKDRNQIAIFSKIETVIKYAYKEQAMKELTRVYYKTSTNSQKINSNTKASLLAWCTWGTNEINIYDIENKKECFRFEGAQFRNDKGGYTCLREVPNTGLLVSSNHSSSLKAAMFELFDVSNVRAKKIFAFEDIANLGYAGGEIAYNPKRDALALISVHKKVSYHLFSVQNLMKKSLGTGAPLLRKSCWHPQLDNMISSFDINPEGSRIAFIDQAGTLLISDLDTNRYLLDHRFSGMSDDLCRCRWSSDSGDSVLYVKYSFSLLNCYDFEKKSALLRSPLDIQSDEFSSVFWLDVCPSNGSLLALAGGIEKDVKFFDRRMRKVVRGINNIHEDYLNCVRWSPDSQTLATTSSDGSSKIVDFSTGKIVYTGKTQTKAWAVSVCYV